MCVYWECVLPSSILRISKQFLAYVTRFDILNIYKTSCPCVMLYLMCWQFIWHFLLYINALMWFLRTLFEALCVNTAALLSMSNICNPYYLKHVSVRICATSSTVPLWNVLTSVLVQLSSYTLRACSWQPSDFKDNIQIKSILESLF
jgi:hypothetical protein